MSILMNTHCLEVAQILIPRPFDRPFSYLFKYGEGHRGLRLGEAVLVPLGKEFVVGYVWEIEREGDQSDKLREIRCALPWLPLLPAGLRELITMLSRYYHVPLGEALGLAVPSLPTQRGALINTELDSEHGHAPLLWSALSELNRTGPLIFDELPFYLSRDEWRQLIDSQMLRELKLPRRSRELDVFFSVMSDQAWPVERREKIERKLFEHLSERGPRSWSDLEADQLCSSTLRLKKALRVLLEADLVVINVQVEGERLVSRKSEVLGGAQEDLSSLTLTSEQSVAVHEVRSVSGAETFLLHGVTGSGKTEVYLELIEDVIQRGEQVLVLIPEIGLTPQTMKRFSARLNCPIYAWHSQLSPRERFETWSALGTSGPKVLVGARSALFAPLDSLGLIIVDESHDSSYKQGEGIRYHARDMAVLRGKLEGITTLLGSATPSLESMYNTQLGKYRLLTLFERPLGATLPVVRTVDLTTSRAVSQRAPAITQTLAQAISKRLSLGEQTILFLNRRGFSQSVRCTSCGFLFTCPTCEVSLPWHRSSQKLQCHHCDFLSPLPAGCPQCGEAQCYAPIGRGTERVEEQLESLFPQAKIARLDRDSELKPQALHALMSEGEVDILIGTQMVTKGHDFPRVTLVGVIDADVGLEFPDFRVNERSFQLLSQVAGRAGRAELRGEVIVQTYRPSEERLLAALSHDYSRFYLHELQLRQAISYPPFGFLAAIRISAELSIDPSDLLEELHAQLSGQSEVRVRGPSPAPMSQVRGRRRWITLLLSPSRAALHRTLQQIEPFVRKRRKGLRCIIDVDPQDFI